MIKYTNGKEYLLGDIPYSGPYNIISGTNKAFTGANFVFGISKELTKIKNDSTLDIGIYSELNPTYYNREIWKPKQIYPIPTKEEIAQGWMYRYFVQKSNSPYNPIIETSKEGYKASNLYISVRLKWYICGGDNKIIECNNETLLDGTTLIPELRNRLKNLLELKIN